MTCPMNYVDPPDVPEGMTLAEYRRERAQPAPPKTLKRLRRKAKARSAARRAAASPKAA
jgi:hypothetical protein